LDPDGNGRIARFLMSVMLASGGYAWTVNRVGRMLIPPGDGSVVGMAACVAASRVF
jgi:hypothetical protein